MGGVLMIAALPLMLLGGLMLDAWTNDDGDHRHDDDGDPVVGDAPQGDEPPLI